jgi:hypothetical protein
VIPYALFYRLGLAPWEGREVAESWRPMLDGPETPGPVAHSTSAAAQGATRSSWPSAAGGSRRVDLVEKALPTAERRAAEEAGALGRHRQPDCARCARSDAAPARVRGGAALGTSARDGQGGHRRPAGRWVAVRARPLLREGGRAATDMPSEPDPLSPDLAPRGRGAASLSGRVAARRERRGAAGVRRGEGQQLTPVRQSAADRLVVASCAPRWSAGSSQAGLSYRRCSGTGAGFRFRWRGCRHRRSRRTPPRCRGRRSAVPGCRSASL